MIRVKPTGRAARRAASLLAAAAVVTAGLCVPVANADDTVLVPRLTKPHNVDDSGKEAGPNRFKPGRDGTVTVGLRWETNNGKAVGAYCHEEVKILNPFGGVVFERQQDLGGGCTGGGGWRARVFGLGTFKYILDVTNKDTGEVKHAELPFDLVVF